MEKLFVLLIILFSGAPAMSGQDHLLTCPLEEGPYPVIRKNESFEKKLLTFREQNEVPILPRSEIVIPVVFHVLWLVEEQNLREEQILSQIDALNRDYGGMNENLRGLPKRLRDLATDTGIRFCIAGTDPGGKATNGILRQKTTDPELASSFDPEGRRKVFYSQYGGADAWDTDQYLNIWIYPLDGILGFSSLPEDVPFPEEDGVVIDPRNFGSIFLGKGSEPYHKGHSLTHEIGHYLGLHHTWGPDNGSCAEDDFVEDTPNQEGPYLGCPQIPQSSCGSEDYFMNFMDFTDDGCLSFFTDGQRARMMDILAMSRPGLTGAQSTCRELPVDSGPPLEELLAIRYLRDEAKVLIVNDPRISQPVSVRLFAMDGRCIHRSEYTGSYTYWLPSDPLPAGIYLLYFELENQNYAYKMAIY